MANIKMKSTDGAVSAFVGGQNYEVDKKGIIEVPVEFEDTLYSFGFITVGKNTLPADVEVVQAPNPVAAEQVTAEEPEQAKEEDPQSHEQVFSDNVSAAE
jgi:DNA-binding transcriptional regulator/RsmH inhibitor MraZ